MGIVVHLDVAWHMVRFEGKGDTTHGRCTAHGVC